MPSLHEADRVTPTRSRPACTRLQSFGLVLAGVTILVVSTVVLVTDPVAGGEILGLFGAVAVAFLVAAWLAATLVIR